MAAEHLDPARPAQFTSWTLPIPNLARSMFGQEAAVLNFFGNAPLHWKIFR
jgi:hypothetical protein